MAEYQYFDGESFITFNIVYATEKEVQLAITNRGRITVTTYDLYTDSNGNEYIYCIQERKPWIAYWFPALLCISNINLRKILDSVGTFIVPRNDKPYV